MKIVVDENIPRRTVHELRSLGHVVIDLRETEQKGADDEMLWGIAQSESSLLITTDKGFVHRRTEPHFGVLVIRLKQPNRMRIHQRIISTMTHIPNDAWPGQTVVVRDRARSVWRSSLSRPGDKPEI